MISINNILDGNANASSLTLSNFVISSADGSGQIIVVGVTTDTDGTQVVNSIVRDTQNFVLLARSAGSGNKRTEIWYLTNPTPGTTNIVITANVANLMAAGAIGFSNVNQTTPFHANNTNTGNGSPTVNVTTTTGGCLIVDVVGSDTVAANPDNGTLRWTESFVFNESRGSTRVATLPGVFTQSYGAGAGDWAMVVGALNPGGSISTRNLRPAIFKPGIAR